MEVEGAPTPAHGRLCCRMAGSGPAPTTVPRSLGAPGRVSRATRCSAAWWGLPASSCGPASLPPGPYVRPPGRCPGPSLCRSLRGRRLSGEVVQRHTDPSGWGAERDSHPGGGQGGGGIPRTGREDTGDRDIAALRAKPEVLPNPRSAPCPRRGWEWGGPGRGQGRWQGRRDPRPQASQQKWVGGTGSEQCQTHRGPVTRGGGLSGEPQKTKKKGSGDS